MINKDRIKPRCEFLIDYMNRTNYNPEDPDERRAMADTMLKVFPDARSEEDGRMITDCIVECLEERQKWYQAQLAEMERELDEWKVRLEEMDEIEPELLRVVTELEELLEAR